jgi:glycosyltransferase involved in cell wall biosynthesis
MNLALIGTRGIPAAYSGFETCVENLGARLARRGHQVTVYNRAHFIRYHEPTYKGVRLVRVPGIATKHLDTITHTAVSMLHTLTQHYDAAYVFIAGNAPLCLIPRLFGKTRVILNVDGLDWKRRKWGVAARGYLHWSEQMATRFAHVVVTDSRRVQAYYRDQYHADTVFIPYGADVTAQPPGDVLRRFDLDPGRYVLFVGRLVPENCAQHLVDAWRMLRAAPSPGLDPGLKCVIVGDAPYAADYIRALRARAQDDPSVVFTGYQFGQAYGELASNATLFVETSEVGGTHPALVEAMAFGNCVVVNDTAENMETIGDAGLCYRGDAGASALADQLAHLLSRPDLIAEYRQRARTHAGTHYSWERVTDQYEQLLAPSATPQ